MDTLRTDVCIIGTGPGGAVTAAHLAADGRKVLMLERGGFFNADHFTHHESSVVAAVFKDGGLQTTDTFDFYILQGQCVGGSGVLSNAVAFRLPHHIHQRWIDEFGFPADQAKLAESYDRVETSSSVRVVEEHAWSPGTKHFLAGCKKLDPPGTYQPFTKAIKDCISCGLCNSTCPYERKRTVNLTYLPHAAAHGAEIITRIEAWKLKRDRKTGRITEVLARRIPPNGTPSWVTIKADTFILAAGAINSPTVLLRSRIGPNAGKFTSFNAGVTLLGEWEEVIDAHTGDDMCAYYIAEDYSFTVESTINPPGACGLFIAGFFEDHAARMAKYRHLFQCGILFPVEPVAQVKWNLMSRLLRHEIVRYKMPKADIEKARRGLIMAGSILFAGGAKKMYLPFVVPTVAESIDELEPLIRERFKTTDDLHSLGSAHPFGGCRISRDAKQGTIDSSFRVHGVENLHVIDGSIFPTAIAVNPMLTIMAIADYVSTSVLGCKPVQLVDGPVPVLPPVVPAAAAAQ
ncbi:MAG: FAD-dependent oxidoreductase [Planctomycetota bacterium]